jgi:hypothetical protein
MIVQIEKMICYLEEAATDLWSVPKLIGSQNSFLAEYLSMMSASSLLPLIIAK